MKQFLFLFIIVSYIFIFSWQPIYGQKNTAENDSINKLFDLTIEELMNVTVVSASKKNEPTFNAPVTISSISKDEILHSGVTTIPEALRLVPGVFVTESTNGNFEVQIRGINSAPPASTLYNSSNHITLVMIDNRPVYNYFNGGTFWETLPIGLHDVERIEVIRGAASALYGPNAAAGVINIITKKPTKQGTRAYSNIIMGTYKSTISNAAISYRKNNFSAIVSANFQHRDRTQETYYNWVDNSYTVRDSIRTHIPQQKILRDTELNPNAKTAYPDPSKALQKLGYNAFLEYKLADDNYLNLTFGGQTSEAHVAFADNLATPLTYRTSTTQYIDAKMKLGGLNILLADNFGTQNIGKGLSGYKLDLNTFDAVAEYDIQLGKLLLKPGVNFRHATYDDSNYWDIENNNGFINGKKRLLNFASSLRAEYTIADRLKLVAATRFDSYDFTDKKYLSYQLSSNYAINNNNIVRAQYAVAYKGPSFYDTFNSQSILVDSTQASPNVYYDTYADLEGSTSINQLQINSCELGYRTKINNHFHFEIDVFYQELKNYILPMNIYGVIDYENETISAKQKIINIDLQSQQLGSTIALNFSTEKFQIKPFLTLQKTWFKNATKYRRDTSSTTKPDLSSSFHNTYDTISSLQPKAFGGLYLNYRFSSKWDIALTTYFYSKHQYDNIMSAITRINVDPEIQKTYTNGIGTISGKVLFNLKVAYKPIPKVELSLLLKNLLNQDQFEYTRTDKVPFMAFIGGSVNF